MVCPHCGSELVKGGIVAKSVGHATLVWYPEDEYENKGLAAAGNVKGKLIGKPTLLGGSVRVDDVFFCENCNLVIAEIPVTEDETKMPETREG